MNGTDEDRRLLLDIGTRLARMEGGQLESKDAIKGRLDRIEETMASNHTGAEAGRRSLHESVNDFRTQLRLLDTRVENLTNRAELMAPMGAVTALNESHAKLESAHRDIKTAVDKLESTNVRVAGITEGVTHAARGLGSVAKGVWFILITAGSVVGGALATAIEHYLASGRPPGK